jgi:hypothetical protein
MTFEISWPHILGWSKFVSTKLLKALYDLNQVSRVWYAKLKNFLLKHRYVMESVDKILFTLKHGHDFLLI